MPGYQTLLDRCGARGFVAVGFKAAMRTNMTKQFAIPNPCNSCHADKSPDWALEQLHSWQTVSPWRVAP